jgi:hypothetical protein
MAFVLADRVRETTTSTGTTAVTLAGAVTGFQTFAAIGDANTTYYAIAGQGTSEWEVGIGTYTASGTTLSRDTVLASSNSGSLVNFSAGTKDVFCDYPAGRAVYLDTATNATLPGLTVNGTQVISVNSASAALRITQTGSGNALLVEDSANPDSTPVVIDASGVLVVGHTTPLVSAYDVQSITTDGASYVAQRYNAGSSGVFVRMDKSRGASIGTNAIVNIDDVIGTLQWRGDDGATFVTGVEIRGEVDGTPGINDMPGRIVFRTTADGASSPTERMRITSAGLVGIGKTPTTALDVAGVANATTVRASNGIVVNSQTVSADYTIATGDNGLSAGPVTVSSGITVTVSSGSVWTVV